jgi:hypothetical protein
MTVQPRQSVAQPYSDDYPANMKSHIPMQMYRAALQGPVASLASSPGDRPDVATVAILGYN